jgi:serine O-acetyltransferase
MMHKYGIDISFNAQIGPGLSIPHFGGIVVAAKAVIGKNCLISHQVTIGAVLRGEKRGACPRIGDDVYIGPGAKLFGDIKIGNNVAIGANSVVNKDIPDNAVVVGVPGQVISLKGTEGIIENTDFGEKYGNRFSLKNGNEY